MATGNYSDSEAIHGCGQGGPVMHPNNRHTDITTSLHKGADPGMAATLGRPKASSDMKGPTPEDVNVAPGQRTTKSLGYGATPPARPRR